MSQSARVGSNRHSAPRGMGLVEVIAIGTGGMVEGGIFSVLGLTVEVAVDVANPESISTMGSSASLIIFAAVKLREYRMRRETSCPGAPGGARGGRLLHADDGPLTVLVLLGMLAVAFGVEILLLGLRRPKVDLGEQFRAREARA